MNPRANDSTQVTFTERGEVALDELAAALTADIPQDPAAIAAVLEQVMSADIEDLAAAVTASDPHRATAMLGVIDGELAIARDAHEIEWETVRAPMIQSGDLTPAGPVDDVEFHGEPRRVELTIDGVAYDRSFDDRVDRIRTPPNTPDPAPDPQLDVGLDLSSGNEVGQRRLACAPDQVQQTPTTRSAPGR